MPAYRRLATAALVSTVAALAAGCGSDALPTATPTPVPTPTPVCVAPTATADVFNECADLGPPAGDGLRHAILIPGTGTATATSGQHVVVQYTGWLENGTKFDSSRDSGKPFDFTLGQGAVIKGWDEGVAGMKVGEKRRLVIPAPIAYGASGRPPQIPGGATLVFDVQLVSIG